MNIYIKTTVDNLKVTLSSYCDFTYQLRISIQKKKLIHD